MPGRNAFASDQDTVAHDLPLAKTRERKRKWEKANPTYSFFVPENILELVTHPEQGIRVRLNAVANREMVLVDEVTLQFASYGLACFERGDIVFVPRPHPTRKKMVLAWEECDGWPVNLETIKKPVRKKRAGERAPITVLAYRWGERGEILHSQIKLIAEDHILSTGEVLVRLLHLALERYQAGKLRLKKIPATTRMAVNDYEES